MIVAATFVLLLCALLFSLDRILKSRDDVDFSARFGWWEFSVKKRRPAR